MVVIRLARCGAKHNPQYRITVADSRRWLNGHFIEVIGTFDPVAKEGKKKVTLDLDKANAWIAKGAQPTDRVRRLMKLAQAN